MKILEIGTPVINTVYTWCSGYKNYETSKHSNKIGNRGIIIRNDATSSVGNPHFSREPLYLIQWYDGTYCSKMRSQFDIDLTELRDDKINKLCY
jgi:hypothetical protein